MRVLARQGPYSSTYYEGDVGIGLFSAIVIVVHTLQDGSGKLEPHEFVVAQTVVAQLAGED